MTIAPNTQGKVFVLEYSERKFLPHPAHEGHTCGSAGYSIYSLVNKNLCCPDLAQDHESEVVEFSPGPDTLGYCLMESQYDGGTEYRSKPVNFCPYCGVKFEYKRIGLTEIEQKCTTTIKEVKETHCTPVETVKEP